MSYVIKESGPLQAKRDKYFKLLGIDVLTPEEPRKAQERIRSITEEDRKLDKARSKREAEEEKNRILYDARLQRCQLALAELKNMQPSTHELVGDFETAIENAAVIAKESDYAGALARLKKVSATHAPAMGEKLWAEAARAAQKKTPAAFLILDNIDRLLAERPACLTRDAARSVSDKKIERCRELLPRDASQAHLGKVSDELTQLHDDLVKQMELARAEALSVDDLRAETSRALNMIAPISGDTVPLISDRESVPMRTQLAGADTAISVCEFAVARAVLEPLREVIRDFEQRLSPLREQWLRCQPQLLDLTTDARKLADAAKNAKAPQFQVTASTLMGKLAELRTQGPGKSLSLAEAVAFVGDTRRQIDAATLKLETWLAFQGRSSDPNAPEDSEPGDKGLLDAQQVISDLFEGIAKALLTLQAKAEEAKGGEKGLNVGASWTARRDEARRKWDGDVSQACDVDDLDLAGMKSRLTALRDEIIVACGQPGLLQAANETGRLEAAKAEYQEARMRTQAIVDGLLDRDATRGLLEQKAVNAICAQVDQLDSSASPVDVTDAYEKMAKALVSKGRRVGRLSGHRDDRIEIIRQSLQQILEPLPAQLKELKTMVDKAKVGSKQAPLLALLETLQSSLDELQAMGELTQLSLLKKTLNEAETFAKTVEGSIKAARGESSDENFSFDRARKLLANLKNDVADVTSHLFKIDTQYKLDEKIKALEKGLGTMAMDVMTKQLADLARDVNDMKEAAREAKTNTDKFEKETVALLLKTLDGKAYAEAPGYRKAMKAKAQALVGEYRYEGGKDAAVKQAEELELQLTVVLEGDVDGRGVPQLLADEEAASVKADNEKRVEQGRWEAELLVLNKQLESMKDKDPREIKPLRDLLDSARRSVDKSKDHAGGRNQLMSIRKRLSLIAANPYGLAITARNKLPDVGVRVRKAITAYLAALNSMNSEVQKLPTDDVSEAGKQAVAGQVEALRWLFNPAAFDPAVSVMSIEGKTREERSGAREQGLREVRRMQGYLENDIRLRTLSATPFHKAMPAVLSELALALLDIENNLLVSI